MAFSNCFIGTVRGYDECYNGRISVFPQGGKIYSPSVEIKGEELFYIIFPYFLKPSVF